MCSLLQVDLKLKELFSSLQGRLLSVEESDHDFLVSRYVGCSSIAGRFTPGAFTNQIQAAFREPRLLLICDPRLVNLSQI